MTIDITHLQHAVWVDAWNYGNQLLNKGQPAPWHDIAAIIAHIKKLQSLVSSDILTLEVGDFYTSYLSNNPTLLHAMGDKRRLGYALRTMLAEQGAREQLKEIIDALCESYCDKPVVLAIPSPKQWIASAHCAAKDIDAVDTSWDDAESTSMYIADFLRSFSGCKISGVLIRDNTDQGPASDAEVARYQPVLNVAEHYRWQSILDGCPQNYAPPPDTALKLSAQDWTQHSSSVKPDSACCYVCIPADAIPETVLEKLTQLRAVKESVEVINDDAC